MKNILLLGAIVIILIVGSLLFVSPSVEMPGAPVAATTFPIYDITNEIATGAVSVELIVPAGVSTHTYEPSPSTIRNLRDTEVVYAIGHGADDWVDGVIESVNAKKVTVDSGINIRPGESDHAHEETDPHYWLTIPNARIIARTIADDLIERFPEHADIFEMNTHRYLQELAEADDEIRSNLEELDNKNLITLHDAWYYFAEEYDLTIVGTFSPTVGREPTPQYLADLIEAIEESESKALFVEPQLGTSSLQSFADDNDLTILTLDPIGGGENTSSYIQLMKSNAETISKISP